MANTQEIFNKISEHMRTLEENHMDAVNGNKAAGRRARKAAGEIKKLATPYKQASVSELK
tara:strand:+ start:66 stop:245 length:180 start_codon:yes stop_codon:yes gene_type:complete